ncbi:hypothetical protein BJ742DRAFT_853275, partial [Cladochytrium replicatum]
MSGSHEAPPDAFPGFMFTVQAEDDEERKEPHAHTDQRPVMTVPRIHEPDVPDSSERDHFATTDDTSSDKAPVRGIRLLKPDITSSDTFRRGSQYTNMSMLPLALKKMSMVPSNQRQNNSATNKHSGIPLGDTGIAGSLAELDFTVRRKTKETIDLKRSRSLTKSLVRLPPNFGSYGKLNEVTGRKSLVFRRKEVYIRLCLVLGLVLCAIVLYEFISFLVFESPPLTVHWLALILIVHVGCFFLCLLSFIYANEAGDIASLKATIIALVINFIAFILKM